MSDSTPAQSILSTQTPPRVLIVDDDVSIRRFIEIATRSIGFEPILAARASEAQKHLEGEALQEIACVLTDYQMPGTHGLDLLGWIRKQDPSLSTIMTTAMHERDIVAESLRLGATDFLDKPIDLQKLKEALVRAVLRTARARYVSQATGAIRDLGRVQQRMLQTGGAEDYIRLDFCYHPRLEAGGDFFARFEVSPGRHLFILTDVSGHDPQAAYISAYCHGMIRGMLRAGLALGESLDQLNRFLVADWNEAPGGPTLNDTTSIALCAILWEADTGKTEVWVQGAPAPLLCGAGGEIEILGTPGGSPLGWFDQVISSPFETSIPSGGSLFFWTDGLLDLACKKDVSPPALGLSLRDQIAGDSSPLSPAQSQDDILFVGIHLHPGSLPVRFDPIICDRYPGGTASGIDALQAYWERSLQLAIPRLPPSKLFDILLSMREAVLNGFAHGCRTSNDQSVTLAVAYAPVRSLIRIRVQDTGPGHDFDLEKHAQRVQEELIDAHRGLLLIKHLADKVEFRHSGALLIMDFTFEPLTVEL